ncbi:MAG TPA: sugar ABC transporter permease [Candidatus Kapabacteria bacterium]|nr:sugar ABC transporter permease [Candidatus Kapabacteria bacterium]
MKKSISSRINTLIFLLPWILVLLIFWMYPLISAAYLSLTKYHTLTDSSVFIGFKNYSNILNDKVFWLSLKNTFIFTIGTVPITTFFAVLLAVILNQKSVKFRSLFRASYFMPTITSLVVISLIFTNLYSKDGYINFLLKLVGIAFPTKGWLLDTSTSLISIMMMDIWISIGYYMVLVLAGLQSISDDLYDSAKLMGANSFTQFYRITLPLLKPTLLFIFVINTIKSFQVFIEIFVMTKGGPLNSTMTFVYYIFVNAFEKSDSLGYGSALAFILFFILIILSYFQMKVLKSQN